MKRDHLDLCTMVNEDGCAILNARAGTITTLNATGTFIWKALERGEELDIIAENLARETGEQTQRIKSDVLQFVDAMKKECLLAG
jgi:hypothetical protein